MATSSRVMAASPDDRSFLAALLGDGRPPLTALAFGLLVSGGVALFLAGTGHFLPHDEHYLGMTAAELCRLHGCRVVHFMVHDRAAFGGVLVAIGLLYLWLIEFPLREGRAWAWWALLASGAVGFASFLAYTAHGYLDVWHGVATLGLLPCYLAGMARTRSLIRPAPRPSVDWRDPGRACLLAVSVGVGGAGAVILAVGATAVFVPQDLAFLGVSVAELDTLNPRLVPLIAHDRAGFGGALLSAGVASAACAAFGRASKSLRQALTLAGIAGFGPAVGVHFAIGYTDPVHLAPAVGGAVLFAVGLCLMSPSGGRQPSVSVSRESDRHGGLTPPARGLETGEPR